MSIPDQRRLADDSRCRYRNDAVFHLVVDAVTNALLDDWVIGHTAKPLIALVLHTRDVLAEQVTNPPAPPEETVALLTKPIDPGVLARLRTDLEPSRDHH